MVEVRSNVSLGALNTAAIIAIYGVIIWLAAWYLKAFAGVNIISMLVESLTLGFSFLPENLSGFLQLNIEHAVIGTFILSLMYAAYIANHQMEIDEDGLKFTSGWLLLAKEESPLEEIEQVYTKDYIIFSHVKELNVEILGDRTITIPFVKNADKIKEYLLAKVRERKKDLKAERELGTVISLEPQELREEPLPQENPQENPQGPSPA